MSVSENAFLRRQGADGGRGKELFDEGVLIDQQVPALFGIAEGPEERRAAFAHVQPGRDRRDELHQRQAADSVGVPARPVEAERGTQSCSTSTTDSRPSAAMKASR